MRLIERKEPHAKNSNLQCKSLLQFEDVPRLVVISWSEDRLGLLEGRLEIVIIEAHSPPALHQAHTTMRFSLYNQEIGEIFRLGEAMNVPAQTCHGSPQG